MDPSSSSSHDFVSEFLSACGPLLDVAKEDASMNGQQPQALATLNGLCSWVKECFDRNGEGSDVLAMLLHGGQPNLLRDATNELGGNSSVDSSVASDDEKDRRGNRRRNQIIKSQSAKFMLENETDRMLSLNAVRAIATGVPRPGHSVVGAGTYRDGKEAWMSLAWEYCRLASSNPPSPHSVGHRRGLEEVILYQSRDGEVATIEHLAHTQPDYLKEAGGAMARIFFV